MKETVGSRGELGAGEDSIVSQPADVPSVPLKGDSLLLPCQQVSLRQNRSLLAEPKPGFQRRKK